EQFDAMAVAGMKALVFQALLVEEKPAVGQNAVDVENDQADCGCARQHVLRSAHGHQTTPALSKSCILSALIRRLSSSTTNRALIRFSSMMRTDSAANSSGETRVPWRVMTSLIGVVCMS